YCVSSLTGRGVSTFTREDQEQLVDLQWETIQQESGSKGINNEEGENSGTITTNLTISGMTCSSCVNSIESNLQSQYGIISCQINLFTQSGVVVNDPKKIGPQRHAGETRALLIYFLWALSFAIPASIIGIVFDIALSDEIQFVRHLQPKFVQVLVYLFWSCGSLPHQCNSS
ncbi:hypothetical protein K7432_016769, partial [Basidiobolus ranarum]